MNHCQILECKKILDCKKIFSTVKKITTEKIISTVKKKFDGNKNKLDPKKPFSTVSKYSQLHKSILDRKKFLDYFCPLWLSIIFFHRFYTISNAFAQNLNIKNKFVKND